MEKYAREVQISWFMSNDVKKYRTRRHIRGTGVEDATDFSRANKKKQSTNIKRDEINIMNIIKKLVFQIIVR